MFLAVDAPAAKQAEPDRSHRLDAQTASCLAALFACQRLAQNSAFCMQKS
jgi:hypothetical protein